MNRAIFINSNDRLFMRVKPFAGKYAAKTADFFYRVNEIQNERMNDTWVYRPINSEIEITSKCNQLCPHCGMAANKHNGISYSEQQLTDYVSQLYDNGIVSFSITGGEPFIAFENMLKMVETSRGKVDVCKITSNGFWGNDPSYYFEKMVSAGLLENQLLVPCLMISIGEQSTPMEDTCAIFAYALSHFSKEEITLCISSLCEYGKESKVNQFIRTYEKMYGTLPHGRIFLTENYYRNSNCIQQNARDVKGRNVADYMMGPVRCFEPTIGKYILPRMLVKSTGVVCTCACFNPPEQLYIGNFRKESVHDILNKINDNIYVKIIAEDGLHNFRHWINTEECKDVTCSNECEACRYLIERFDKIKRSTSI